MNFQWEIKEFIKSVVAEPVSLSNEIIYLKDRGLKFTLKPLAGDVSWGTERVIWEDQWWWKKEIVKSRIRSVLGLTMRIHGRETQVEKVAQPVANAFLNDNHLIGATSSKTKLALVKQKQIFALATFSKPTKINRDGSIYKSYELIRYCNFNNHTVVGGLSKLINHFVALEGPDDIMTYVDKEWSEGSAFQKLGFKEIGEIPPRDFWVDTKTMTRYWNQPESKTGEIVKVSNLGSRKLILFLK